MCDQMKLRQHQLFRGLLLFALTILPVAPALAAIQCYQCHGNATTSDYRPIDGAYRNISTGAFQGNHQTHMAAPASPNVCTKCHNNNNYTASHRDGFIHLSSNINASPAKGKYMVSGVQQTNWPQTNAPVLGTCSNVNCHFETATPQWGSAPFSAPADCNKCHGAPPNGTGTSGAAGSHTKHDTYYSGIANCQKCHPNNTTFQHATSAGQRNLAISFAAAPNNGNGVYSGPRTDYLPSQTNSFGTCRALYCHSNGARGFAPYTSNTTATWGGSLTCKGCHKADYASGDPMATGSHGKHVNGSYSAYNCVKCHAATVTSVMAIGNTNNHVNNLVNIAFNNTTTAVSGTYGATPTPMTKAPGSAYAQCGNVYCHSIVQTATGGPLTGLAGEYKTPTWGSPGTGACGTCHDGDNGHTGGAVMSTGSHTKHLSYQLGTTSNAARCAVCHNIGGGTLANNESCSTGSCHSALATKHSDHNIDVNIVSNFGGTYAGNPAPGTGYSTCSNNYCHSDGLATPVSYATPKWGDPTTATCGSCHGADATTPPASTPHTKHVGSANPYRFACIECHSAVVSSTTDSTTKPTITSTTLHVNKMRNVNFDPTNPFGTYSTATLSCRNMYCHSTGNINVTASKLPAAYNGKVYARQTWSGTVSCNSCHGRSTPGSGATYGMPDYTNGGSFGSISANSHPKHVSSSGIRCVECHERTTKTNTSIRATVPSVHTNGNRNVYFNLSGANKNGTYNGTVGVKKCSSTYCHGTNPSVSWGASTICSSCHGATYTTFSSSTKKGAHAQHIEADTNMPASYVGSGLGNLSSDGTKYQFGCASCHNPANAGHANAVANSGGGAAEVYFGYTSAVMKGTYAPGTVQAGTDNGFKWTNGAGCNATYCHSNGNGSNGSYNVNWGTANGTLGCTGCHGDAASNTLSGKHQQHVNNPGVLGTNNSFGCVDCHAKTVSSNTAISNKVNHVNKLKDYSGVRANGSSHYSTGTRLCTNIYCHSNGNPGSLVYQNPAAWNSATTYLCNGCHGTSNTNTGAPDYANGGANTATANSHPKHVSSLGITDTTGCNKCHYRTVDSATANKLRNYSTQHLNQAPNVYFKSIGGLTGTTNVSGYNLTCSNTYCHGAAASVAWGGSTYCNSCHSANDGTSGGGGINNWGAGVSAHTLHVEDTVTLPSKYNNYSAGNLSSSATTYRFGCAACHNPANATHANGYASGTYHAEVFFGYTAPGKKPTYTYTGTAGAADNGFNWSNGNTVCNQTYCHSNGAGTNGSAVTWATTANSATNTRCKTCHGYTTASGTAIATGDHTVHINGATYNFSCRKCHAATTTDGTSITDKTKHVNKAINIAFNNTTTAVSGTYNGSASPMSKAPGSAYGSCTNVYCHSKGTSLTPSAAPPNVTPTWGSTLNTTCSGCHGNDNSAAFKMGTVGSVTHTKHVQTYGYGCVKCHAATVSDNRTINNYANHVARQVNVAFNNTTTAVNGTYNGSATPTTKLPGSTMGACGNTYCHSNGTSVATGVIPANTSVTWSTAGPLPCTSCHGAGGTTGAPYYSKLMRVPTAFSGGTNWTTPGDALLGNKTFASYANTAQNPLILTTFGYTTAEVADTDTVTGITVIVEGWAASGTTPGNQLNVQLTQNGSTGVGTAKTISLPGTTSAADAEVYATTTVTDLWGTTWTPAQIRATTFGVILKDNDTTSSGLNIDLVRVIVHTSSDPKMNSHSSARGHRLATCNICHTSVTYSGGVYTPDPTKHVNGSYNIQASMGYTFANNGGTCATPGNGCHGPTTGKWGGTLGCVDCHNKTITRTLGRPGATLANVVAEFGLAWGHKNSGRNPVTDDDCIVCHLEGDGTTHKASKYHQDGNIDLRDPDGAGETPITNISGGAFTFQRFSTSYAAGSRTSTSYNSNTDIANVITQKFCLVCHSANGATNPTARSNNGGTGTATMPFGGINLGANYTVANGAAAAGGLVDVNSQFATTNSSYHPVRGPLNRDFPTAARMNDPYKPTGTRGTSGTLTNSITINCFDCHNQVGTPLTRRTIVAHGNAVTVRGYPIANTSGTPYTGTSPVDANKPTLCIVCHAAYDTQAPHGAGSAWQTNMDNGMAPVVQYGCNICHASNYATVVVRPVRAMDVHGVNTLPTPSGSFPVRSGGRWATTGKPVAFIRNVYAIDDHAPKKVGATTYTTTCMSTAASGANPSFCGNQGAQGYTVGGTY